MDILLSEAIFIRVSLVSPLPLLKSDSFMKQQQCISSPSPPLRHCVRMSDALPHPARHLPCRGPHSIMHGCRTEAPCCSADTRSTLSQNQNVQSLRHSIYNAGPLITKQHDIYKTGSLITKESTRRSQEALQSQQHHGMSPALCR